MGQRHQYVIVYDECFYNAGNGNNRPERAEVIHHQWLYGRSAIASLERALMLIKNSWDGEGTDYLFGRTKDGSCLGDGTDAIAAAISVDPAEGYYHHVSQWVANETRGAVPIKEANPAYFNADGKYIPPHVLHPDHFDNNDGITLIRFKRGEKLPGYCFITPNHLEGAHWPKPELPEFGPWSALQYLDFYYSPEQQAEWGPELQKAMLESIARIDSMGRLMSADEVAALLPKFPIGKSKTKKKVS
jgi:hypothetical protein